MNRNDIQIESEVVVAYPPNIEKINDVLGVKSNKNAIYAYEDKIYSPFGDDVSYDLHVHERVHFRQHRDFGGSDLWWDRYLEDIEFRLDQELEAYRAQLAWVNENMNRQVRRDTFDHVCKSLSSKMYGNLLTKKQAGNLLKGSYGS